MFLSSPLSPPFVFIITALKYKVKKKSWQRQQKTVDKVGNGDYDVDIDNKRGGQNQ